MDTRIISFGNLMPRLLLASLPVFLAACSSEDNNLPNPPTSVISKCSDISGATCVSGRFIDDAVKNLNYTCDKVTSVTDVTGAFSCPVNTTVTFSLRSDNPNVFRVVTLGSAKVLAPAKGLSDSTFYITPRELAGNAGAASFNNAALNIVRLLQLLDQYRLADLSSPADFVDIRENDKVYLALLSRDIVPVDFALAPAEFDALIAPLADQLIADDMLASRPPRVILTVDQARQVLEKGMHATVAGVYQAGNSGVGSFVDSGDMLSEGFSVDYFSALNVGVDRRGRLFGFGVYSELSKLVPADSRFITYRPEYMDLNTGAIGSQARWSNDARIQGMRFDMQNGYFTELTQGTFVRGVVAGSKKVYDALLGEESTSVQSLLGRWRVADGAGSDVNTAGNSRLSMFRSRNVVPTIDPDIWATLTFPMHVTATFYDADSICRTTPVDPDTVKPGDPPVIVYPDLDDCPTGSPLGELSFTILADGNIVSDFGQKCATVDAETLQEQAPASGTEIPLGMVIAAFVLPGETSPYLTLSMLLPRHASVPADLIYAQMGINNICSASAETCERSLQIRLKASDGQAWDNNKKNESFPNNRRAIWSNQYHQFKASQLDGSLTADQKKAFGKKAEGTLISQFTSCPP